MIRSNDLASRTARLTLATMMTLAWTGAVRGDVPLDPPPAAPTQQPADFAAAAAELEKLFAVVDVALRDLPRDTFDPQAVIEQVGRDPDKLFAWVRDNTSWVPYRGALRGPVGVLMDRSGNSLDRAMLLAELLRGAGVEARLARAALAPEQAKPIVEQFRTAKPAPVPAPAPADKQAEMIASYAKAAGIDAAPLKELSDKMFTDATAAIEIVKSRTDALAPAVLKAVPAGAAPNRNDKDTAAASDHWWAQYRSGQAWKDLDPALPTAVAAESNLAWNGLEETLRQIPELCHEIGLSVIIERWENGKLTEATVLGSAIRPAETIGRHASLSHLPIAIDQRATAAGRAGAAGVKKEMLAQTQWLPILAIGKSHYSEKSFDDAGAVYDKPNLDPTGKLAGAAAKNFGGLGAALGGGGGDDAKKSSVLTAEWVQYQVRSPGNEPYTIRRAVFDLIGPAARAGAVPSKMDLTDAARVNRALVLSGDVEMLPLGGRLAREYVAHLAGRTLLGCRDTLLQLMRSGSATELDRGLMLARLREAPGVLHALAIVRHAAPGLGEAVYLDRPNLLTCHGNLRLDPSDKLFLRETLDVVANYVAVRPAAGDPFAVRVRQGVADTAAEAAMMSGSPSLENTTEIFAKANEAGIAARAARLPEDLNAVRVDPDGRARLQATLAQGYVIVIPQAGIASPAGERSGWWRVDPNTGETVGVMDSGFHAAVTENQILRLINGLFQFGRTQPMYFSAHMFRGMGYRGFAAYTGVPMSPCLLMLFRMIQQTGFFG